MNRWDDFPGLIIMMAFNFILQSPVGRGSGDALSSLNTLGLAVFLVGLGLILLMVAHWYRMKDTLARKQNLKTRYGDKGGGDDITQLQYLTREELKEMVIREKAAKEEKEAKSQTDTWKADTGFSGPSCGTMAPSPGAMAYRRSASLLAPEAPPQPPIPLVTMSVSPVENAPSVVPPSVSTPSSPKTQLLVRLAMAEVKETEGDEKKDEPPKPPKNPYHDKIERSIMSNESLENWKGKSRKI